MQNIKNLKKFYKHIIVFIALLFIGSYLIDFSFDNQKKKYLELQTELIDSKYKTNYKYFKIMSQDVFSIYENNSAILEIIQEAKSSDTKKRDILRQKLYNKLKKRYKRLKNMGILQMHFHFSDNISFLRMHKPDKFGDDLTFVRESVVKVNKTKEFQEGFEVGKVKHGFRFVYPLSYKKEHIGSVEISFSSSKLVTSMLNKSILHTHFLISKKEIEKNTWEDIKRRTYEPSAESSEYLLDSETHSSSDHESMYNKILTPSLIKEISYKLALGKSFTTSNQYNHKTTIGSFIPIQGINQEKAIAYLAVYSRSVYLDTLVLEKEHIQLLFISILLLLFIFSIYVTLNNVRLEKMAHFDKLTALPNRAYFYIGLEIELSRAKRKKSKFGLMFIDLDGFKAVNDTFGHDVGDKLLIDVSRRLTKCVRDVDIVARLGGDEFTVVVTDIKHQEDTLLVANKIIAELSKDFLINKEVVKIGASIGISTYPTMATDSDTLIKQSDTAMYEAKDGGKNRAIFYKK